MLRVRLVPRSVALPVLGVVLTTLGLSSCGGADQSPSSPGSSSAAGSESATPSSPSSPSSPSEAESPSPSDSASASATDDASAAAEPGAPDCASVWTAGGSIPRVYSGCNDGDIFVVRDTLACSSGQRFVRFDDRFYGVLGGTASAAKSSLDTDKGYRDALASCRA